MAEVEHFLDALGLPQYAPALVAHGYDDLDVLAHVTAADLADPALGLLPGHRTKLLIGAARLRDGEPLEARARALGETVRAAVAGGAGTARGGLGGSGTAGAMTGTASAMNAPAGPLSQTARRVDSQELQHVRSVVKKRGGDGINGLSRIFRQFDDNGNHKLDKAEFITGLQNYGVRLSKEQFNSLFKQFDRNGDTVVSVTEFLRTVAGPLNRKRREIVDRAFDKFDRDDSGAVTIDDLVGLYKTDGNPDVQSGRKTAQQVLTDFLNSFQAGADGHITTEDFAEYYANISCGIDSDEAFELLLTRSWDTSTNAKLDSYKGGV